VIAWEARQSSDLVSDGVCQIAKRFRLLNEGVGAMRGRYSGGGKRTVESCRSIDVLDWHRRGYLKSPRSISWAWTRDGQRVASINVETQRQSVTLRYRSRSYGEDWTDVKQQAAIAWTPCRFGGERPWFICSVYANGTACGRQVAKLYDAGQLFACRHCYRLAYGSQQESAHNRGLWKAQKIRVRLGGSASMLDAFPENQKACTGKPMSVCAAFTMQRKRGQ
jgi:hypothetical protein